MDQPTTHLQVTVPQLLDFLYGDEEFYRERHWLVRNTMAAGYCRVVSQQLASEVFALDPGELYTHIQEYFIPDSHTFFTLWRRQEWRESNERIRLSKLSSTHRCAAKTTRDDCEHIARCVARKVAGQSDAADIFVVGLMASAQRKNYDIVKFLAYIKELNTNLPHLDLVSEHNHYLTTTTNT